MKKFCYSLESVYRFKQNVLDKKKEELAKKEQDVQKQKNLLEDELTRLMVIAEEKKKEVIKAHMDTNTFEKLKEKRLEEYRVQGRKAEESFIEEFVTHAMKA